MTNKPGSLNAKNKDEAPVIQNALNSLKKSLVKSQANDAPQKTEILSTMAKKAKEEAKRKEDEKNLGPDDIVEYRGMKMTVSQREEYMEMEDEQIMKFR